MIDSYIDPLAFAALDWLPTHFAAYAKEANMSSVVSGTLREIDAEALAAIRSLPSYRSEMLHVKVGDVIEKTVDLLTSCGNINLVHESLQQLEEDYRRFHEICERGIFVVD